MEEIEISYLLVTHVIVTRYTWQQSKEIKSHTELGVEEYYGARGVDGWNEEIWEKEIDKHDVSWLQSHAYFYWTSLLSILRLFSVKFIQQLLLLLFFIYQSKVYLALFHFRLRLTCLMSKH